MNIYYKNMSGLINNPYIYSTIQVCLVDSESNEIRENLYNQAAEYCKGATRC